MNTVEYVRDFEGNAVNKVNENSIFSYRFMRCNLSVIKQIIRLKGSNVWALETEMEMFEELKAKARGVVFP